MKKIVFLIFTLFTSLIIISCPSSTSGVPESDPTEIDESLLPDIGLVDAWIKEIENPNFIPAEDLYGDLVKKQHLEEA